MTISFILFIVNPLTGAKIRTWPANCSPYGISVNDSCFVTLGTNAGTILQYTVNGTLIMQRSVTLGTGLIDVRNPVYLSSQQFLYTDAYSVYLLNATGRCTFIRSQSGCYDIKVSSRGYILIADVSMNTGNIALFSPQVSYIKNLLIYPKAHFFALDEQTGHLFVTGNPYASPANISVYKLSN